MIDSYLVPQETVVSAKGDSNPIDISAAEPRVFLLTLNITQVVEQESLDVVIQGSANGTAWTDKPLLSFPQKFYPGEQPLLLDLSANAEIKFVRAHWDVNRWGRGSEKPMFEFGLSFREVPAEILKEAAELQDRG